MRDEHAAGSPAGEAVALEALLYASGELDADQTRAFEERLATEQPARDALSQVVRLTLTLEGRAPAGPDPAYRARVRQRLRRRSAWSVLIGKQSHRGHPVVWSGMGAAAAVLMMIGLGRLTPTEAPNAVPAVVVPTPTPAERDPDPEGFAAVPTLEEATTWAGLSNRDHLAKAHEEEVRRKNRAQELQRLTKTKADERRNRLLTNPGSRH